MKLLTFIGTYTDADLAGIHILETDTCTGALRPLDVLHGIENPTYLAVNRAGTRLYTVRGFEPGAPRNTNGAVAAYAITEGKLSLINCCPTRATVPCHIALSPDEQALIYAEYTFGHVGIFGLTTSGAIDPSCATVVQHAGSGPNPERQERAHAHYAGVTPDGKWLYACDLGMDQVVVYDFAQWRQGLRADPDRTIHTAPGAGPRHLRFHPDGTMAFLLNELDSTVMTLRYTGEAFIPIQTISALPDGISDESKAAAIKISEDGRFLFTSNRGYDSIATFAIDRSNTRMTRLAVSPLTGRFPRDFACIPGSSLMLVGHKLSNELVVYAFDPTTGMLARRNDAYPVHQPTCIVFSANPK